MKLRYYGGPLPEGRGDPLGRIGPHIAYCEHSPHTGFKRGGRDLGRIATCSPWLGRAKVVASADESLVVDIYPAVAQPASVRL
jgi:hypothetical protein